MMSFYKLFEKIKRYIIFLFIYCHVSINQSIDKEIKDKVILL